MAKGKITYRVVCREVCLCCPCCRCSCETNETFADEEFDDYNSAMEFATAMAKRHHDMGDETRIDTVGPRGGVRGSEFVPRVVDE